MLASSLAPAVLTVFAAAGTTPTEWAGSSDIATGCAQIGSAQAYDGRHIADGGKQMASLQLRTLAERASADAYLPQFVGGGEASYTQGSATLFKCAGPWLGGGLPPPAWPYVTTSLINRSFLPAPRVVGPGLGASATTLGELILGSSYAQTKALLNSHGIAVKQASAIVDLSKGVPATTAVLTPEDDARGRRWLYLSTALAPRPLTFGTSLMALGFDASQSLVSIVLLNFGDARGISTFTADVHSSFDNAYRRTAAPHGPSYWLGSSQTHPLVVLFSSNDPTPYAFILFTTDNLELAPDSPAAPASSSSPSPSAPPSTPAAAGMPRAPRPAAESTCQVPSPETPLGKPLARIQVGLCNSIQLTGGAWVVSPTPSNLDCTLVAHDQVSAKCPSWGTTSSTWGALESAAAESQGDAVADCLSAVGHRLANAAKKAKANAVIVDSYDPSATRLALSLLKCNQDE